MIVVVVVVVVNGKRERGEEEEEEEDPLYTTLSMRTVVCGGGCLLEDPATCLCISLTDLLRQLYELPHWNRNCRSNFLSHPVTVYWHWTDQSHFWPSNTRRLAGQPQDHQCWSHWCDSTWKKIHGKKATTGINPTSAVLEEDALPLGQRGGCQARRCLQWPGAGRPRFTVTV